MAALRFERAPVGTSSSAPRTLGLRLQEAAGLPLPSGDLVATASGAATLLSVAIDALDASDRSVPLPGVPVLLAITATPSGVLRLALDGRATGLPGLVSGLEARGTGRARLRAVAALPDRTMLVGELLVDLIATTPPPPVVPGPPVKLLLRVADPAALGTGTDLLIELVDRNDLHARGFSGTIDLSAGDPWIYLPEGPSARLTPLDRGYLHRRVARPSGPRDLPVVIRVTASSSTASLNAALTLPILAIDPETP